ncbi:MAG: hypothetical protein ACQESP_13210 [Candidatus Muiribacteriota bacterium]
MIKKIFIFVLISLIPLNTYAFEKLSSKKLKNIKGQSGIKELASKSFNNSSKEKDSISKTLPENIREEKLNSTVKRRGPGVSIMVDDVILLFGSDGSDI